MTFDPGMRVFLTYVLLGMPALGVASYFRVRSGKPLPPKKQRYRAVVVLQIFLLALTLIVARQNEIELFGPVWPSLWTWLIAAGYLALIALRLNRALPKISQERKQRTRLLLPEDQSQMRIWILISVLAGLSEECAYRGLAYMAVGQQTGSRVLAIVICTAAFGVAHMLQGWRGVLGTAVIALVFHGLVFLTQGLYLAIGVHILYDVIIGVLAMRMFLRESATATTEAQVVPRGES
jgi:membrane protease YdiL (CAAX protease family)